MAYYEEERKAIETRFSTHWLASSYSSVPIQWPNIEFDPLTNPSFVSINILPGMASQISLGSPAIHRYSGVITNSVYIKANAATKVARQMSDTITDIWRNANFIHEGGGRILCRTPSIAVLGTERNWFRIDVTTSFIRDEQLTTQPGG